jgi:rhamnose transport system substrate-binding protein
MKTHTREISVAIAILALAIVLAFIAPGYFSRENLGDLFLANVPVLIVALGMTMVILIGQIDISVGSIFAICSVVAGLLAKSGLPAPVAAVGACLAGAALGALNGTLVAYLRIPSIVVTLATMVALRDALRWQTQGAWVQDLPADFQWFGLSQSSYPIAAFGIAAVLCVGLAWILRNVAIGRAIYATGSSPEGAHLAGIRTGAVTFSVFVALGTLIGLSAAINSVRFNQIPINAGLGLELKVIAAVVVGGAAITGGRGSVLGTVLGIVLLGAIGPALTFLGVSAYWERAVQGGIILAALVIDAVRLRRRNVQALLPSATHRPWRVRLFPNGEWALVLGLVVEVAIFSAIAENFFTWGNFFEMIRFSVELGLLALALTPVIITGGIDLSVGSMMGLAAVIFGAAWRDWHLSLVSAAAIALLVGWAGGSLNAVAIARLNLPPLIVTLGSFSMFRGIAEGITHGAVNYTDFPKSFLFLGQGYVWGVVPVQLAVFLPVFIGYAILLHRSVIGRGLYAIGFTAAGARYAGIPVSRRISLVYVLSGLIASIAAIVYVAHLGQAKSDVGTGYELDAITAVVLGGTSVFGGRGTVWGTVLGLISLTVLQNGLHLAALPSELTGVLTGTLLVVTIVLDRIRVSRRAPAALTPDSSVKLDEETIPVRNSQLAILCATVLAGSLIVAVTNVWLVRSVGRGAGSGTSAAPHRPVIAMMPKAKGDPYFVSARAGAEEAAHELGVELIWDGPTSLEAAKQNELVENWITRKVDAIAVAVENKAGISTVLRKARERGIKVLTWDADAEPDARDFFVNQATPEGIANTLTDEAGRLMGGKGEFAIVTGALSAANQNEWIKFIRKRLAEKYPNLKLATIRPSDDDRDKAFSETQTVLKVFPQVKLMMAISAPAVPGAAEAVRQAGRKDVFVIGLSLPSMCKPYVHDGTVQTVVLWSTRDLGYLTVYAGSLLAQNKLAAGAASVQAGRLGSLDVRGSEIILGAPLIINKTNIDQLDF